MMRCKNEAVPVPSVDTNSTRRKVVIVCQKGQIVSDVVKYGTFRATIEFARYLTRKGIPVTLVGCAASELGFNEGIHYVGVSDMRSLFRIIRKMAPIDTLVGISRSDVLRMGGASRYVIFQHNPSVIQGGMSVRILDRSRAKVVTVSDYSKMKQIEYGVRQELIGVVPNGCDTQAFSPYGPELRQDHSLVFAGHMVPYKGLDIALRAFAIVRQHFPDATFSAYGQTLPWSNSGEHVLDPGKLDRSGFPVWRDIENDIPGFHYCGEVTQDELASAFRRHSLLVIPSRIEETFGIVSLEAQACGCIPVLPRRGGFPETLRDGETGYLYDDNTAEGLATKVVELWRANLPKVEQRVEAVEWVRNTFSWESSGESLLKIIESIPPRRDGTADLVYRFHWYADQVFVLGSKFAKGIRVTISLVRGRRLTEWPGLVKHFWLDRLRRLRAG